MPKLVEWSREAVRAIARTHRRVFSAADLQRLLLELQATNTVPSGISSRRFIETLNEEAGLRAEKIPSVHEEGEPPPYRAFHRYVIGTASPEELAVSLRPRSYLSHGSALHAHGLCGDATNTVYVNQEQSAKPAPRGKLTQEAIDRAFTNRARTSQYVFAYGGTQLVLLAGKHSGNHRVIELDRPGSDIAIPVTDLPRTLVDVTVRPMYAGGPAAVLEAYRHAITKVQPRTLVAELINTLETLGHMYPYHQAIGSYLKMAGLGTADLGALREIGTQYDFYLCNRVEVPAYDPEWRIHVPRELLSISSAADLLPQLVRHTDHT